MNISIAAKSVFARAIVIIRKGWCREYLAIDRFARPISSLSRDAVAWCALGAIDKVVFEQKLHFDDVFYPLCRYFEYKNDIEYGKIMDFNDLAANKKLWLKLLKIVFQILILLNLYRKFILQKYIICLTNHRFYNYIDQSHL